jgi:hypothetical protein
MIRGPKVCLRVERRERVREGSRRTFGKEGSSFAGKAVRKERDSMSFSVTRSRGAPASKVMHPGIKSLLPIGDPIVKLSFGLT